MKLTFAVLLVVLANNVLASDSWKKKLVCTSNSFMAEVFPATNEQGTERGVYFAKNSKTNYSLVTNRCKTSSEFLVCKSSKVELKIDFSQSYGTEKFYKARATDYSRLIPKTEVLHCSVID